MNKDTHNKPKSRFRSRIISLLLAPFFAALIIWQWPVISGKILSVKHTVETFIADIDAFGEQSRTLMAEVAATKLATEQRLNQLEMHLVETQRLQGLIELTPQASDHETMESLIEEIAQLILNANQHLSITTDINIALESLHMAEALLTKASNTQLSALHDSIALDIERLEATLSENTMAVHLSIQLKNLATQIDQLPFQADADLTDIEIGLIPEHTATEETLWIKFLKEIWNDIKTFIHIQKVNDPDTHILPPSQTHFLSENLKLKFILMRFSLLSHDKIDFDNDLEATKNWINQHYAQNSELVMDLLKELNQLHDAFAGIEELQISASLDALHHLQNLPNEENK